MTQEQAYVVTVVLDPDFGDKLRALPAGEPVWAVDTPANRAVGEAIWRERPEESSKDGLTLFKVDPDESPSAWLVQVIPDINLHHGEYSHAPPYSVVAVIGVTATTTIRETFADYGLGTIVEHPGGFQASRS